MKHTDSKFSQTALSAVVFEQQADLKNYLERTKRNRFWVGSEENQMRLRNLRVGVAGLGGMGSNIAEILVRLGVGHLKITDPDIIETSNLNRQVIANRNTIGMKKAMASAQELRNISEDFELVVYDDGLTKENAKEFVSDLDIIIDEIDVAPLRPHIWLHAEARKLNIPLYSGYIIGMGTHIYKFQGDDFTYDDFLLHREDMYDKPSLEFIVDRFFRPAPSYMEKDGFEEILNYARESSFPIFGATTYGSQSCVVIRMVSDFLALHDKLGSPQTPVMPKFIKFDSLDYTFKVCDITKD